LFTLILWLSDFASGYIRLPLSAFLPSIVTTAITTLLSPFLYLNPLNFSTLPRTHPNLPLPPTKHPLIVWSHGLTGTGDEHGLLATTLALKGYVVALVHHSDGSSARCDVVKDGVAARVDYQHVDFSKYDANLRQNQADWRAREVNAARDIVLREFPENVTASNVSVGGFSFGAATAGVVAATRGKEYRCAVLVDGWYHIYFEKYGIDINLPLQLHEKGSQVPTLFIGSEEFQKLERLCAATLAVQKKCPKAVVKVYEGTRHGNFIDAIFWLPMKLGQVMGLSGKDVDSHLIYKRFFTDVGEFLDDNTRD